MPFKIRTTANGGYSVSSPNSVHSKNTTKEKAEKQLRLLNAIEYGGFKPGKKKSK